jgi:hypothetical protein
LVVTVTHFAAIKPAERRGKRYVSLIRLARTTALTILGVATPAYRLARCLDILVVVAARACNAESQGRALALNWEGESVRKPWNIGP